MRNKISIKRLELINYRNIDYAVYDFDGNSKIIGENRTGKTNTLEAIYWLLTDKLLDGSSDIASIKPQKDTKLEVRVKGVFEIIKGDDDSSYVVSLEKTYKENWVKTRGTTELEMKGHSETLYYNGVKQSTIRDYNNLVNKDFGFDDVKNITSKIDLIQLLINPFYLGNMGESKDWTELRNFIIGIVGDVSDNDVLNSKPEFAFIKNDLLSLNGRVDLLKKKYSNDIESIKNQILAVEGKISLLESTEKVDENYYQVAKKCIDEIQEKIAFIKSSSNDDIIKSINEQISNKNRKLLELQQEQFNKSNRREKIQECQSKINETYSLKISLFDDKTRIQNELSNSEYKKSHCEKQINELKVKRLSLIDKIKNLDNSIKNPSFETECPKCHRPYDEKDINELREKAIKEITTERELLIASGKETKKQIDLLLEDIEKEKSNYEKLDAELTSIDEKIGSNASLLESLRNELNELNTTCDVDSQEIIDLKAEIETLNEKLAIQKQENYKELTDKQTLIMQEQEKLNAYTKVVDDYNYYHRQMATLEDVKKDYEYLMSNQADAEQKKEILNGFMYAKLKMINDNVSKVFGNIKFQLIKENINGGYDPICKPYIYDIGKGVSTNVSWKSGSKSERLTTGIAIVECIKKQLSLCDLPILFDEGGEVSTETLRNRIITNSQIICVKIADNITSPIVKPL